MQKDVKVRRVNQLYEFGPFRLDPEERTLWRGGEAVPLTVKAFEKLLALVEGGFFCYPYLRDDPLLADLRGEPAYAALLESARKSHEEFRSRFF
jgi:hypothetical protein